MPLQHWFSLIIVVLLIGRLPAQGPASQYVQNTYQIDFRTNPPTVLPFVAELKSLPAAAISDEAGELLFYTDGSTVFTHDHTVMTGGELHSEDLPVTQSSIIVAHPGSEGRYFIFLTRPAEHFDDDRSGMFYAEVDMGLQDGRGEVVTPPTRLTGGVSRLLSAYHSAAHGHTWIMTRMAAGNSLYAFKLTENGLQTDPVTSSLGVALDAYNGQLKFSPDGRHVAIGTGSSYGSALRGEHIQLFDFDAATGKLSNLLPLFLPYTYRSVESVEFSPDGTLLYAFQSGSTYEHALYQYDITVPRSEVDATRYRVAMPSVNGLDGMQLAANGKIYLAKGGGYSNGRDYLAVVNEPNRQGRLCDFVELGLHLAGADAGYNTPLFRQDLLFGTSFNYGPLCAAGQGTFTVSNTHQLVEARWDFGDGAAATGTEVGHTFAAAGRYTVTLYAIYEDRTDTIVRRVTAHAQTPLDLGSDRSLCRGAEIRPNGAFAQYWWSTGDTTHYTRIDASGAYSLTAVNEVGCVLRDTVTIDATAGPALDLPDYIPFTGDSITLEAGDFASYEWSTGETTPSIRVGRQGWYSVEVSNTVGCRSAQSVYVGYQDRPRTREEGEWMLLNPKPTIATGLDVAFLNRDLGFITGGEHLLRTTDAGASWDIVPGIGAGKRMAFADGIGYLIGDYGKVYRSTHYGEGWNVSTYLQGELKALSVFTADTVLVTGAEKLYFSYDGGGTWTERSIPEVSVTDAFFTSTTTGFVAGKQGTIRKTTDGGKSWRTVFGPLSTFPSDFLSIYFVNDQVGFAAREHSDVYRTTDGGESWLPVDGYFSGIYTFHFVDEQLGFMAGHNGAMFRTTDGGASWKEISHSRRYASSLYGIAFTDRQVGYATGQLGRILKTTDGGDHWEEYAITYKEIRQIEFGSRTTGYALVYDQLFRTTDRGDNWQAITTPVAGLKTAQLEFLTDREGYAVVGGSIGASGSSEMIYKTEDGGLSWAEVHDGSNFHYDITSLTYRTEQVAFATSGGSYVSHRLHKSTDGGKSWYGVSEYSIGELQFVDEQTAYGIQPDGYSSRLYRTSDAGESWEVLHEAADEIQAFQFVNDTLGYYVGDAKLVAKTVDGGLNWNSLEVPYDYYVDLHFYSVDSGYILNEDGGLLFTEDGGTTWSQQERHYGTHALTAAGPDLYLYGDFGRLYTRRTEMTEDAALAEIVVDSLGTTTANLTTLVPYAPDTTYVYFEYGTASGTYDEKIRIAVLVGKSNRRIDFTLTDLMPGTTYFGRASYDGGSGVVTGPEIQFQTALLSPTLSGARIPVTVSPNPARTEVVISAPADAVGIGYRLYDQFGRTYASGMVWPETRVNVSTCPPGVYYLMLSHTDTRDIRKLLIVR